MMLYILDENFNIINLIEKYQSVIWNIKYYECGEFELYAPASSGLLEKIKKTNYIVRDKDITGNGIFKNAMIVDNIELTTNIEDGNFLKVTGYCLKSILKRRIIWGQYISNDTPVNTINNLLEYNIINPNIEDRKIPNFIIGSEEVAQFPKYKTQWTGDNLYDVISSVCKLYGYGFDIYIENGNFVFTLMEGKNRTLSQSDNAPVVFSPIFDNVSDSDYKNENMGNYSNTALVAGEGQGINRKSTTITTWPGVKGIQRREIFVDARDLSSNDGTISDAKYLNMLKNRGSTKLNESTIKKSFEAIAIDGIKYSCGKDYGLGDIVEIQNEYGMSLQPRVTEIIESEDENGRTLVPTFKVDEFDITTDKDDDLDQSEPEEPTHPIVTFQDGLKVECVSDTFLDAFDFLEESYPNKTIKITCDGVEVNASTSILEDKNATYFYDGIEYIPNEGDESESNQDTFSEFQATINKDTGNYDFNWNNTNNSGITTPTEHPGSWPSSGGGSGGGTVNTVSMKIASGEITSKTNTLINLELPESIKEEEIWIYLNGLLVKRDEFELLANKNIKFNFYLSVGTYYQIHYLSVD